MKKHYRFEDVEITVIDGEKGRSLSYRLDTYGCKYSELLENAAVVVLNEHGEEIEDLDYDNAPEEVQLKILKMFDALEAK